MSVFVVSVLLVFGLPFIVTEVVDSFQICNDFFLENRPPMIAGILENSVSLDNNIYKIICQKYKNIYRYATFYDMAKKIPVFSAYRYTGYYKGRPRPQWMIEPQLETLGSEMREPCVNQASSGDYWKTNLTRGHLFPNGHAADKDTAESTFTLTNTVPQYLSFNNGSWIRIEKKVRDYMNSNCSDEDDSNKTLAYVLTGAVPGKSAPLNKRVNVPSHMWTAFCCYNRNTNTWVSEAHWAENKEEKEEKPITDKTLQELQKFLSKRYNREYTVFDDNCSGVKRFILHEHWFKFVNGRWQLQK